MEGRTPSRRRGVSLRNTTDELTRRAHTVCNQPDDLLLAALLATGEAASSALLGLSLNRAGIPATVLDAQQAGLCTSGPTLNSDLIAVDAARIFESLSRGVVVLPGFVGRGERGETTLLGRGGSDLTALFLAQQLGGVCRLVKDVDGLYTCDPNSPAGSHARRFARISYGTAAKVGGSVVQPKTIEFAEATGCESLSRPLVRTTAQRSDRSRIKSQSLKYGQRSV